jgi:hypothetical protein
MSQRVKVCATIRASQSPGPAFSISDWNTMPIDAFYRALNNLRVTPQATVEAIMVAVRERGLSALEEPANIERLNRCDRTARAQLNERITRLIEQKGSSR